MVGGRPVCVMANDYTVKAGSWGEKTVQKIVRIQERAERLQLPLLYLVDAAGGRISEQIKIFPGRYHAGRIFYNEVRLSGVVPQVCILLGPSPAGSAYLPALTDLVIMVDGKASLYVGSPRMVEMAIGEKTTLEELGGARMHCTVSGCGDVLAASDEEAIELARRYLAFMPGSYRDRPARAEAIPPRPGRAIDGDRALRSAQVVRHVRADRARGRRGQLLRGEEALRGEIVVGLARLGAARGGHRGESAQGQGRRSSWWTPRDKAARFINLCNAFNIPLCLPRGRLGLHGRQQGGASGHHPPRRQDGVRHLAGHRAEDLRGGAEVLWRRPLRHVRARLRARRRTGASQGQVAHHGARARRQRRLLQQDHGAAGSGARRLRQAEADEYAEDVDIYKLASEMLVDGIVSGGELRDELIKRLAFAETKEHAFPPRRNPVLPV